MINSAFKNFKWVITGLWIILVLSIFVQFIEVCPPLEAALFSLSIFAITYPVTTYLSKHALPKALKDENIKGFVTQFVLLTILLAFLNAAFINGFVWLEKNDVFPTSIMFFGMARPLHLEFLGNILSAFAANLMFCAIRFFEVHYKMQQEHAKLKQAHLEDELQLLHAQINPHLMFNVLNHIHILMKKNVEVADELLLRYSDVLRYQLYECDKGSVLLEKEVDYLKDVIEIEKVRWGKELTVDCIWNIENGRKEISPLLLIPFVENAFKHVSRVPSAVGFVNIMLNQKEDILRMVVENSKSNQPVPHKRSSGVGLENVKKRLEILYPEKHVLLIQKTDAIYKTTLSITL